MIIRQNSEFKKGYNEITSISGKHSGMLMDFGILKLKKGDTFIDESCLEKVYLLISGSVNLKWADEACKAARSNCFDENPWCLHADGETPIEVEGLGESEVAVIRSENKARFDAKLYTQADCNVEERGKGTMKETSTRLVKTIFDNSNAPYSNLVVGEVIGFPGKWSSYPPHHHPQPEIYFYKFFPENGFGFSELGEDAYKLRQNDTVLITEGLTHSQTTSPGHTIYYLWVIRHLDDNRYIAPIFLDEYKWLMDPKAVIWPDVSASHSSASFVDCVEGSSESGKSTPASHSPGRLGIISNAKRK
jgi:5-deoxy-glucuronate isomerase